MSATYAGVTPSLPSCNPNASRTDGHVTRTDGHIDNPAAVLRAPNSTYRMHAFATVAMVICSPIVSHLVVPPKPSPLLFEV